MTEETREIQLLRAARGAISSGEIAKAISIYEMAFEENPENPEAKYFYHFNGFINSFSGREELKYPFLYLINSLEYAVKYVAEFDCTDYEKGIVIATIKSTYNVVFNYLVNAYDIFGVDLMDEYIIGLYWLGSYIKNDFKEKSEFWEFAVEPWEKAIELHQEYGFNDEYYRVEDYAQKLREIKPEYVIPTKPAENIREKKAREKAEQAEQKALEEREKAEKKARKEAEIAEKRAREEAKRKIELEREETQKAEAAAKREAEEAARREKNKIKLIIVAAIIGALLILERIIDALL